MTEFGHDWAIKAFFTTEAQRAQRKTYYC